MPMLYSLGQHGALQEVQYSLRPDEYLFAYLDDIYVVCSPERVSAIYKLLGQALEENARIQMHMGKTQVWNRGGHMPPGCDAMQVAAQRVDLNARVWRANTGFGFLRSPSGMSTLSRRSSGPPRVHERLLSAQDLQSAWLLLLFCANARATYSLRGIPPSEVADSAEAHNEVTWQCFIRLLSLPLDTLGGCGLLNVTRSRVPAHWASWADSLHTICCRHPALADMVVRSRNLPASVILTQQPLVARNSAIMGKVPWVGWLFSQLNPKHWQFVSLAFWPFLKKVGSGMHHRSWSSSSWTLRCCLGSLRTSARCSAPKVALWRHSLSVLFSGSIPTSCTRQRLPRSGAQIRRNQLGKCFHKCQFSRVRSIR